METRSLQLSFRVCHFAQGLYCYDFEWDLGRSRLSSCEEAGVSESFCQYVGSTPSLLSIPCTDVPFFHKDFYVVFSPSMIFENQAFPSCFMETLFCFIAKRRGSLKETPMLVSKFSGGGKKQVIRRIACYWGLCLAKQMWTVGVQERAGSLNLQQGFFLGRMAQYKGVDFRFL